MPHNFLHLTLPSFPLPTANQQFSVSVSLFLFYYIHSLSFFRFPKWKHMVFVFLCLTYFAKHNTLQIYSYCCRWQDFMFLWLSNTPVCVCITPSLSIHLLSCCYMFIVVNNASLNIEEHVLFQIWYFCFLHSGSTSLHPPQFLLGTRVLLPLHPHQHLLLVIFLMIAIWHFIVVWFAFISLVK